MIQSQIVLHRFEAVMRRAGWVARRCGPLRDHFPARGSQPAPRTIRWGAASPDGPLGLNAGVRGLWYGSFPASLRAPGDCSEATTFCVLKLQTLGPHPPTYSQQRGEPKEREGSSMVPWAFDGKALPRSGGEKSLDSQFKIVAGTFLELFELLEEYAPIWYTDQHHQRALTQILGKPLVRPVRLEKV